MVRADQSLSAQEYIAQRVEDQIGWYNRKSMANQRWFKWLRLAEIVAAASIPLFSGFIGIERPQLPILVGVLGAVVAVIAAILGLFQFEQHWIEYRTTCESLKKEKFLFMTGSEPYDKDPSDNLSTLVQRAETLISKENTNWAQYMMRPGEESDG